MEVVAEANIVRVDIKIMHYAKLHVEIVLGKYPHLKQTLGKL
jgi:hypothetical protein